MTNKFLGKGWKFPTVFNEHQQIVVTEHEESVRQSIWLILSTAPGERVMRPDFGCGIHGLVFEPNNPATATRVSSEVRQALLEWEPRIDILNVTAEPQPGDLNTLLIRAEYRTRTTNNRFNLVFPFYLE